MDSIHKLIELFREFPGIGPRQARRFAYFLLTKNNGYNSELATLITKLKSEITTCASCYRFFAKDTRNSASCSICRDPHREKQSLMIVGRDVDLENIEKSHVYNGLYFVLGGSVPILEKEPEGRIRQKELREIIEERGTAGTLKEIIFALNATPEGENTEEYLRKILEPLCAKYSMKMSVLGRGLSTGTELEYSDTETIKQALKNRQ